MESGCHKRSWRKCLFKSKSCSGDLRLAYERSRKAGTSAPRTKRKDPRQCRRSSGTGNVTGSTKGEFLRSNCGEAGLGIRNFHGKREQGRKQSIVDSRLAHECARWMAA